jgi:methylmalonyl-CoA mutase N-terminal domain/subunit
MNAGAAQTVRDRYAALLDKRNATDVNVSLTRLADAATKSDENLMPYLVDCCHAYVTIGEMVACLKSQWGEFQEPLYL